MNIIYAREAGKSVWYYSKEAVKEFNETEGSMIACLTEAFAQKLIKAGIKKDKIWIGKTTLSNVTSGAIKTQIPNKNSG